MFKLIAVLCALPNYLLSHLSFFFFPKDENKYGCQNQIIVLLVKQNFDTLIWMRVIKLYGNDFVLPKFPKSKIFLFYLRLNLD